MQNSSNIREQVSQVLLNLYSSLNPEFQTEQCNYTMLETFYNVIGDIEMQGLYDEIDPYIQGHTDILRSIIQMNQKSFIFNQPAYLFVYFSLWHWNNKIIDSWPYDYESLLSVIRWSGYSTNILYDA